MDDRERRKCVIMKNLGCDEKTALEILEFDRQVDQGLIKDDLTPEQKKVVKKYTNVARGVNAYGKEQSRTIKADEPKQYIIELINTALNNDNMISDVEIINKQKTIMFKIGADTYEIDLKRKRK
jgi:hypothetical protein